MSLNLKRFLRWLPRTALRDYLCEVGADLDAEIDWTAPDGDYLADAVAAIGDLQGRLYDTVWSDFDNADLLGKDDYGRKAMRSVIGCPDMRQQFDTLGDTRACALWLARRDQALFDRALAAHYADRHLNGRNWGAYALDSIQRLSDDPVARDRFGQRLTDAMNLTQAKGLLRVDWFERDIQDNHANSPRQVIQAAIYREEPPQSELAFDDQNEITSRVLRPVAEAALVFDAGNGDIDIVCKGGRKAQDRLCWIFCETMLGVDTPPVPRPRPPISFRPLMSQPVFDIRPGDCVRAAEVERLRLRSDRAGGLCVTLECRQPGEGPGGTDL